MDQSKIPIRYAKALFLIGKEHNIQNELAEDVKILAGFLKNSPSVIPWLRSPFITIQEKIDFFRNQFGDQLTDTTYRCINLVINKKRENYLPAILRNFIAIQRKDAGIRTLIVTTAVKIDDDQKQKIIGCFEKKYRSKIYLIARVNPALIAGFKIQVDDMLYDASLATELKRLKRDLTGQVIEKAIKNFGKETV